MKSAWISLCIASVVAAAGVGCGSSHKARDAGADVPGSTPDARADVTVDVTSLEPPGADAPPSVDASDAPAGEDAEDAPADDDAADARLDSSEAPALCGSSDDPKNCGTCGHDCTRLPHVQADRVTCRDGVCRLSADSCVAGFAHCSTTGLGCETDVTTRSQCGGCAKTCSSAACASPAAGPSTCVSTCEGTGLTACGQQCVDTRSNPFHCGGCGKRCSLFNAEAACVDGACVMAKCAQDFADCDPLRPGCETASNTFYDCGGCGLSCEATNTVGTCGGAMCSHTCQPGYGDCDRSKPDCENALDTDTACGACGNQCPAGRPLCGGSPGQETCMAACEASTPDLCGKTCTSLRSDPRHCGACGVACDSYQLCEAGRCSPRYVHTDLLKTSPLPGGMGTDSIWPLAIAIAPDGSYVVGGVFDGTIDFDPGAGQDIARATTSGTTFVTKFSADGAYAWTRTFSETVLYGLAVAPDGTVVLCGSATSGASVVALEPSGTVAWARIFAAVGAGASSRAERVAVTGDGSVIVVGLFAGQVDFDPGPGTDESDAAAGGLFAVKLSAGRLIWARTFVGDLRPGAVRVHPDGTIWLGGQFQGTGDFDPGDAEDPRTATKGLDVFVERLDGNGLHLGVATIAFSTSDDVRTLAFSGDGSAYVGGMAGGDSDAFYVWKMDAQGRTLWTKASPALRLLGAVPDGGFLTGDVTIPTKVATVLVRKRDGNATPQWTIPAPVPFWGDQLASTDGTKVIVVGGALHGGDHDPGAGADVRETPGLFISRYGL
jgi:hypothetical protein